MFKKRTNIRKSKKVLSSNKKIKFRKQRSEKNISMLHQIKLHKFNFLVRSWLLFAISAALLAWMYIHTLYLQVYENKKYELSSIKNYVKVIPKPPERGIITDRNGIGLALNSKEYGLFIAPMSLRKAKEVFKELQKLIPLTEEDFNNYILSKRNTVVKSPSLLKSGLTEKEIALVLVNKYKFPEISIQSIFHRYYPYKNLLAHTLGYVGAINDKDEKRISALSDKEQANYSGTNIIGKIGIEKHYEKELLGTIGYDNVEVNSLGEIVKIINSKEPLKGNSLRLSIDLPTQIFIKKLLGKVKGAVILTNPETNEIISIVSNPSFDINLFVRGIGVKAYKKLLDDENKPLYNRATLGIYPPGSTIKPFMGFAGLASQTITPNWTIFDPGYWILPNTSQKYRDWLRSGHGEVNLHKAITESVDTYFYDLAHSMGIKQLNQYMPTFGFGKETGIDIDEESSANYPTPEWKLKRFNKPWLDGDTPPVGIGQGYFTITPIQLSNALNSLINRGFTKQPHLLNSYSQIKEGHQYSIQAFKPKEKRIFTDVNPSYWDDILNGMWGVVNQTNGSGYKAFLNTNYTAAGKSGTAQVFSLKGGDYQSKDLDKHLHDHALFIAFAPYDNPKASITVIIENGGGGSRVAAPIARSILDYYIDYRLPRLSKDLSCQEIQKMAITDIEDQGYSVNITDDVFNLQNLTLPNQTCKHL